MTLHNRPKLPTVPDIKQVLRAHGVTARRTSDGEIRVNLLGFPEDTAYYTTDVLDALGTGLAMARANNAYRLSINERGALEISLRSEVLN